MPKTSDFALNLLDELRSRKQRMATSSPMVADACASNSKTAYKSPREPKTLKNTGFRAGSAQNRPSVGKKSVTVAPVSDQIVPFGRGQKSGKIGKMSMTLALAVENGGKLGRTNSSGSSPMFSFVHNIGRKQMERRNSRLPNISHLRMEEISRGVEKLNQILRNCSNGLNFDRFSIQIGGELLKGVMDLEKSLTMLFHMQDASDYSITKPRKNRITLLDDDEKHVDISRSCLARASKNLRPDLKPMPKDVTYSSEGTKFKASNSHPRKRSVGYASETKTLTAFSEQKHSSSLQSKPEKLRFPNVIAKLMGLDELPGNVDSTVTARVVVHDKLPPRKDLEHIKAMTSARKTISKIGRQQSDMVQLNHNYGSTKGIQEKRKNDRVKHREHKMAETKEPTRYAHKGSEAAVTLQAKLKYAEKMLHGENRYANKILLGYQQKLPSDNGFERLSALQRSELQTQRRQSSKQKRNEPKCSNVSNPVSGATETNLQKKQTQMKLAATSRKGSTEHIDRRRHKNQAGYRSSTNLNIEFQGSLNRNSRQSRRDQDSESAKARVLLAVDEKPVRVEKKLMAISTKGCKLEVHQIDEVMTKKGASLYNLSRTMNHQNSILQERKQTRPEKLAVSRESNQMKATRFEEVEPKIIESNKSIEAQEMQKTAKRDSVPCSVLQDDCKNLHKPQALVQKDSGQTSVQDQEPDDGSAFKSSESDPLHSKCQGKPMCKDFDKLEDCSLEDYLAKMVEADVMDKEPELNCMWDLGWNCMMLAFMEKDCVIRDVENYVLNGLLVGITRDLFTPTSVSALKKLKPI